MLVPLLLDFAILVKPLSAMDAPLKQAIYFVDDFSDLAPIPSESNRKLSVGVLEQFFQVNALREVGIVFRYTI